MTLRKGMQYLTRDRSQRGKQAVRFRYGRVSERFKELVLKAYGLGYGSHTKP